VNGTAPARLTQTSAVGRRSILPAVLLAGGAAVAAATVANNSDLALVVTPILAVAALLGLWVLPLRIPLYACVFLGLGIDATSEGIMDSPFAPIGEFFTHNLNKSIPIDALAIPLLGLVLVYLAVIHIHRRFAGSRVDGAGVTAPMSLALAVSLLAVLVECAYGYASGGNIQMAKIQVQFFVLTLLMAYLLAASLRGVRDYRVLGGVIVAAACSKALIALWVYYSNVPRPEVATTHGDSLLFAGATIILVARFAEQPVRRHALQLLGLAPLLLAAMKANNRRLVWVELVAALALVYFLGRRTRIKRVLTLAAIPLAVGYVAIGWTSNSSVFAPLRALRTAGNANLDASTLYRDLENFDLLQTMRDHPVIGSGFGHPFEAPVVLPDISFFKEYQYMPHNSILGLWAFTGWLGFTGLFTALVAGVFWAARSYRFARLPDERAAALVAISFVVIYLIQCWGDIGFSEKEAIHLLGPALAVAGQLAVSTGAWASFRPAAMVGRRI
jgi:hypothetical protein